MKKRCFLIIAASITLKVARIFNTYGLNMHPNNSRMDSNFIIQALKDEDITMLHIEGPLGVRERNSYNRLILVKFGWTPSYPLEEGLGKTYCGIDYPVNKVKGSRQ